MSIVFSCQKETARFSVSPSPGVEDFKPGEDTVSHSDFIFPPLGMHYYTKVCLWGVGHLSA